MAALAMVQIAQLFYRNVVGSLRVWVQCDRLAYQDEARRALVDLDLDLVVDVAEADIAVVTNAHLTRALGGERVVVVVEATEEEADEAVDSGVDYVVVDAEPRAFRRTMIAACREAERTARRLVYRKALDLISDSVEITNANGELIYVNPAFTQAFGYTSAEALGRSPAQLMRSEVHDKDFYQGMWDTAVRGDVWHGEMVGRHKDGRLLSELTTIAGAHVGGRPRLLIGIKQLLGAPLAEELEVDNVERLRSMLSRLRASEQRFQAMVQAATDAVFISDMETALITYANPAALAMYGYTLPEFRRMNGRKLSPDSESKRIDKVSIGLNRKGQAYNPRIRMLRKDGSVFWASMRCRSYDVGQRNLYVAIVRDVSDLVERERHLEQAEERALDLDRMAAIGKLAASIAHEINNPASIVQLNLQSLAELEQAHPEAAQWLEASVEAMARIERVGQQLHAVTRLEPAHVVDVDVSELAKSCVEVATNFIRHRAKLVVDLGDVPKVAADPGRLSQVMTNLLVNAAQAIEYGAPEDNRITVRTRAVGRNVLVTVGDTGSGMTAAVRERIFDPFFSTKGRDGAGLGLSLSAEIARTHRGEIIVDSEPGRGTVVSLQLPIDTGLEVAEQRLEHEPTELPRLKLLFIDDEIQLLKALGRRYRREHDVTLVSSAEEALQTLGASGGWDAIICDVMMPTMDGPTLYMRAIDLDDALEGRFIFCTGGVFTEGSREFAERTSCPVLDKPVQLSALDAMIQQIVSRSAALLRENERREVHAAESV